MSLLAPVVALVLALSSALVAQAESADDPCSVKFGGEGICTTGGIQGGGVGLQAENTRAGVAFSSRAGGHSPTDPLQPTPSTSHPAAPPPVPRGRMAADVDVPCSPSARLSGGGLCSDGQHAFLPPAKAPTKPADPAPVVAATPGVSLADVAQFVPRDASIRSQPNGWAIVGAPVNLFTDATTQVVGGTLLGRPAQVRFVPVSFTWDHGDGTSSTVEGPGSSWKALGQQDSTATDTSHVYPSVGVRQVTLTIAYSPSYRFDGGGWQQIPGTLPVQVGPVTIRVLQGSTVLVGGACGTRDAGPGCP
ncbi:putative secreted protein [Clavibacter sepedonicus]|uniref:Secreted protein n=1 Tax=Clavibacter sepedonicus TaxID=31964 RepID=B0RGX2_CLASE|nr:putative secreted protein [Clavibacter sepedonicus]